MKTYKKIICIALLITTAVVMFLPIGKVFDDTAAEQKAKVEKAVNDLENAQNKVDRDSVIYDIVYPVIIDGNLNAAEKDEALAALNEQRVASGEKAIPQDLLDFLCGELTWDKIKGLSTKMIDDKAKAALLEEYGITKDDFKLKDNKEADQPRIEEVKAIIESLNEDQVSQLRDRTLNTYYTIDKSKEKVAKAEEVLQEQQTILAEMGEVPAEELATFNILLNGVDISEKQSSVNDAAGMELDRLQINTAVVNKSNGYPVDGNLASYRTLIIIAMILLIAAAILMLGGGTEVGDRILKAITAKRKLFIVLGAVSVLLSLFLVATTDWKEGDVGTTQVLILIMVVAASVLLAVSFLENSKRLYTIAAFANLLAIVLLVYSVLRLNALPLRRFVEVAKEEGKEIQAKPAVITLNPLVMLPLLAMPIAALAIHIHDVHNTKRSMIYVFCSLLSAMAILPFWIMIVNATRSSQAIQQGVSLIPSSYLGYNWNVLATKNFSVWTGFRNSAIIAFGSTILSVYFSAMTAYGFKVYTFKGRAFLYAVVMAIIMIPGQVTGTGFFIFMYQLGLTNNFIPLIIPAIAAASTVFFFRQYLEANLQISLVEAARIDGCNEFITFNKIILPIMVPAMATMGIMAVIGSWNNYLTPLMLLSRADMKTLPMLVKELRGDIYKTEYGSIYLGLTMTALPLMIVYFVFSKYIIAGVALGGVKE